MGMKNILITGTNRGIGLGLASKFLVEGYRVVATCRKPDEAQELQELKSQFPELLRIEPLDLLCQESVENLARSMGEQGLDVLINNAGILPSRGASIAELDPRMVSEAFEVNVVGAIRLIQSLKGNLDRCETPVLINISSKVGSIADNQGGGIYAYRISKTAQNMLTKNLSIEFKKWITVAVHPGWVQTSMGGPNALISVEQSSEGIFELIKGLQPSDSGRFFDYAKREITW